jgi:hypothetical protein
MPDISMCADNECPSRFTCYRHKDSGTKPSKYQQAYAAFNHDPKTSECESYWPVKNPEDNP